MAEVLGFHHVSLSVTDLGTSTEWYRQTLGLDVDAEFDGNGFRRARLRAAGSGLTLTLTSHDQESGDPFSERRAGLDHVAFQVGDAEDVQELKRRFEELGVDHSEVKEASSGAAMITLRDPDNIQLEVFGGSFDAAIAAGRSI
jgi:glyoxylase I family protein